MPTLILEQDELVRKLYKAKASCEQGIDFLLKESLATYLPYRDLDKFLVVLGQIAQLDSWIREIDNLITSIQKSEAQHELHIA